MSEDIHHNPHAPLKGTEMMRFIHSKVVDPVNKIHPRMLLKSDMQGNKLQIWKKN